MKLPQGSLLPGSAAPTPSTQESTSRLAGRGLAFRIGFGAVLLLGIFAWAPATYPGYWQALEGFSPVFNATRAGGAALGAMADLWRGAGTATYLLVRPLLLMGLDATAAVRGGFILYIILGGLGIYVWLQQRLGDRAAGLAGLLYMLAPPLLATVYIRGTLSDMAIVALLPFALAGLTSYCDTRSLSAVGIGVIAMWWMWQAQAGLAVFASLLLIVYMLSVERSWVGALIVILSSAAGLTSLTGLLDAFGTTADGPVAFAAHFVYLFQFFGNSWRMAPSVPGWQDGYPFQLGLAMVVFSALSFWLWSTARIKQAPSVNRLLAFSFGGSVMLLALCTPASEVLWRWSNGGRLLTYPWQLVLIALPLLAVTAGSLPAVQSSLRQTPYWLALVVLTLTSSAPYLHADYTQFIPPASPLAFFGANDNLTILDLSLTENRQPRSAEIAVTWQTRQPLTADYNVFFQALRAESPRTDATGADATGAAAGSAHATDSATPNAAGQGQTLTVVRQLDQQPFAGAQPATTWEPGKIYTDTYQLDLSNVAPDDQLIYYFGYYDWRDGARLPVNGGIDDKLIFYGN